MSRSVEIDHEAGVIRALEVDVPLIERCIREIFASAQEPDESAGFASGRSYVVGCIHSAIHCAVAGIYKEVALTRAQRRQQNPSAD